MENNLQQALSSIKAMRAAGQSDDTIVDRIQKSANLSDSFKKVFANAKASGIAKKAVDDFLSLPIQQPTVTKEEMKTPGMLGKAAEFLGVEPLGRYLSAKISMLNPEQRKNIEAIRSSGDEETAKALSTGGVTGRELAGSVAQTGLSLATPFLGKTLASGNLLSKVGKSAALGGAFGASGAAQQENGDLGTGLVSGAITGGAIPLAGAGIKYVASRFPKLLSIFTGEGTDLISAALKDPKAADLAIANGDSALRTVVKKGAEKSVDLRNSFFKAHGEVMKGIAEKANNPLFKRSELASEFSNLLEQNGVKVGRSSLDFTGSKIIANPGEVSKINAAWNALRQLPPKPNFQNVQDFKQIVGKLTRFADEAGVPSKSPTLGRFYRNIDTTIKNTLPAELRKAYSAANEKFSNGIDMFDDLVDAFTKGDPFSKIANSVGKNRDSLRQVLDFYKSKTGEDVLATVAGRELSAEKSASFGFLNPRSWIDFFISPQAQARIVTGAGRLTQGAGNILNTEGPAALRTLKKVPAEKLNTLGRTLRKVSPESISSAGRKISRTLTGSSISQSQK